MDILLRSSFLTLHPLPFSITRLSSTSYRRCISVRCCSLPFPREKAKFFKEIEAAVDVVQRACQLCVDVKSSLLSSDRRIVEKNDQTPVTIADFGVQALISLELGQLFPLIPLVAEEDSSFLISNNLADLVVNEVADKARFGDKSLSKSDILEAIDRGAKDAFTFGTKPATYWVLDPIDGTKGFLKGSEALYVVGLALVVEGEIVAGVMGCPNWKGSGIIMVAHIGHGTWQKAILNEPGNGVNAPVHWTRCSVDRNNSVHEASFCISDSQNWASMPLSAFYNATSDPGKPRDKEILLLPTCCGSLCKYLMVASGRASVFMLHDRVERTIKTWDHAVGVICVHEAGGKVTDWEGKELDLAADKRERRVLFPSGGILVTNNRLHNQILGMITSGASTT